MTDFSLSPQTTPGRVVLAVPDLDRSLDFYQHVLGFRLHHQEGQVATLGAGQGDLLELHADPGLRRLKGTTGLYHFAILVPTRRDLAFVLRTIAESETAVSGFADHLVSEAIYLPDPDGNGIEIYCDRPRDTWRGPSGNLRMGTEQLDLGGLLAEVTGEDPTWDGLPAGTRLGHVHLHVADLEAAIDFYREALGLDLIMRYGPSAAFLSAGGYHHHVGINTWNGEGAPKPPENATGLRYYSLHLPDEAALASLRRNLDHNGIPYQNNGVGIWLQDPSANRILVGPLS